MRDAFVAELTALAEHDPSIMLVTGDLGFGVLTEFARRFPGQYLNAGVAEQNMAGLAAGLALEGRRVFTYSIANFSTLRCLEQIRNDICYHGLPVTVVAVGGGFAYGSLGFSHHATEDVAIMSALPGMCVMAPNDPVEARACTAIAGRTKGPCYLRLGRNTQRTLHASPIEQLIMGRMLRLAGEDRADIVLIGGCGAADLAIDTASMLGEQGLSASAWSCPFLSPFDRELVEELCVSATAIVSIEEHSELGGLGARCAQAIARSPHRRAVHLGVGIPNAPTHVVGDHDFMRGHVGLTVPGIRDAVLRTLGSEGASLRAGCARRTA